MTHAIDPHVILVCFFAVAFVFVVSGLGDKPRKKQQRTYRRRPVARKPPARAPKPLPRPTRRR
jgi:hypothetical protein